MVDTSSGANPSVTEVNVGPMDPHLSEADTRGSSR